MKAPKTKPAVKAAYRETVAQKGKERRKAKPVHKEKRMTEQKQEEAKAPAKANDKAEGKPKAEAELVVVPGETPKEPRKPLQVKVGPKGEVQEQVIDPTTIGNLTDVTVPLGIVGQSVTSVTTYRYATTEVVDILAGGSHYFIKSRQGLQEVGGTADVGTGVKVGGR